MTDLLGSALELVEAGGSMQEAPFYDLAMTGEGEPAMLPVEESPWLPVYQEAARWIPSSWDVIDLGCGTGRFAAHLLQTSFVGSFTGIDFSSAAIAEARRYVADPRVAFKVGDLRAWRPRVGDHARTAFVCLEVLEHLEADRAVIKAIPRGSQFIFSVPSYMSASHVRCFASLSEVFERYGGLLDLRRWSLVDFGRGNVVHVCDSIRRQNTW